jgi:hypothetical protein
MQANPGRLSLSVATLALMASCSSSAPNDPLVALYCDDGYVLNTDATGCIPAPNLLVQGIVTDLTSGMPIPGVTITVFPFGAEGDILTTDVGGYFSRQGVATSSTLLVSYIHPDYAFMSKGFDKLTDGTGLVVIDASAKLQHDVQHARVAGTVYAGDAPAPGVHVYLSAAATGPYSYTTVADDQGHFAFEDVLEAAYYLRVPPYDGDGDQVNDWAGYSLFIGNIGTTLLNVSNLVVSLPRMTKQLLYTNLLGVTFPASFPTVAADCAPGAAALCSGLGFINPADDLVFHFGAEVDVATVDVLLRPFEPTGGYGTALPFVATWSVGDTVLTLNPAADLVADADIHTQYEVTFNSLVWKDGQIAVSQASSTSFQRFRFDLDAGPTLLASPTPAFYTDNIVATSGQVVDHVTCDADACLLLDQDGFYVGGFGAATSAFTGATGLQLVWPAVPGAHSYNVYARQQNGISGSDNFRNWYVVTNTIASGTVDPVLGPTVYATGVMAANVPATPREWADFDPTLLGTLTFGSQLEIVVTAVTVDGFESPIDPSRALTLEDRMPAALQTVTADVGANPDLGTSRIVKITRLDFNEGMDTAVEPTLTATSGNIMQFVDVGFVGWDPADPTTPQNVSASALVFTELRIRGACTPITCTATYNAVQPALSDDRVCVADPSLFAATNQVFFLDAATATRAHVVRTVSSINAVNGILTFSAPVVSTLTPGSILACLATALTDHVATVTNAPASAAVAVDDARLFYATEPVMLYDTAGDDFVATTVSTIDTATNTVNLALNPGAVFAGGSTTIQRRPLATEYAYRASTTLALRYDITTAALPVQLDVTIGLTASTVMVGDLLLVDQDGDLRTIGDEYYGKVSAVVMTPDNAGTLGTDESDYHLTIVAPPAGKRPVPAGLFLLHGVSTVTCLGDSLKVVNSVATGPTPLRDTSGNVGLTPSRDEWSAGVPLFY